MQKFLPLLGAIAIFTAMAETPPPVAFDKNFEDASIGKIEKLGETEFRCHVQGQADENGRNRQATWYFFRIDHVRGRALTLHLTDFVGEYDFKPACAMNAQTIPVFSGDGKTWTHFDSIDWDDEKKEATLKFTPQGDSIWIAHVPPYPHSRLLRLIAEIEKSTCVEIATIGKTVLGRDLHLVTVTNGDANDAKKKCVWLQARQHAWEAGTSFVMEGALRFIVSDDARARALRDKVVFKFTPMLDPDGCARGGVRFNANGYDVNRHWSEVRLDKENDRKRMPEIFYTKRALYSWIDTGHRIDLLVNMHNTETSEFMENLIDAEPEKSRVARLFENLKTKTIFDPSRDLFIGEAGKGSANVLWKEKRIPISLMEQRISYSQKLGRRPTIQDREQFGRELIVQMAETALAE